MFYLPAARDRPGGRGFQAIKRIKMIAQTLMSPAQAGFIEFDGKVFYKTAVAASRQVIQTEQFILLTSNFTLTSQTAAQKAFNSTTNGAVTVQALTSYFFECAVSFTTGGGSNADFGFAFGGTATLTSQAWRAVANIGTTYTNVAGTLSTGNSTISFNTAANTTLTGNGATGQTNASAYITGLLRVATAGTLIPQVSMTTATAGVMQAGSYFRIRPIGTSSVTNVGNWS